jgi:uncharacterized membrane protein
MIMHERALGDSDNSMAATTTTKDENAVNHEIATLLLNLASRTSSLAASDDKLANSSKTADVAMDLSIYAKSGHAHKQQQQPSSAALSNGNSFQSGGGSGGGGGGSGGGSNPYSLFPLSSVPALPSSYLLQNLLIGNCVCPS